MANMKHLTSTLALFPLYGCFVGNNWKTECKTHVIVIRSLPTGDFLVSGYLLDLWCLGIKDAFLKTFVTQEELIKILTITKEDCNGISEITYEDARSVILGSLKYAESLGFEPHKDWQEAQHMIEPHRSFENKFTFGHNGKPYYVSGPYDDDQKIKDVMKKVDAAGGESIIHLGSSADWEQL